MEISRRTFVASGVAAASTARVVGANDRIRLGVIGSGGRGQHLIRMANAAGGVEWVAICDAWDQRRDEAETVTGTKVQAKYGDYRQLLDRKDIDAVIIATWDNMHAPIAIDACKAGKDIFVEKPMTSRAEQGPPLVKAVREHKRVLQVGTQQRSLAHYIEAKQRFFDTGAIGRVHLVRTIWNYNLGYLTPVPAGMEKKPEGLDWEACLGWLPKRPWDPKMYFNRFAYWELGTGAQTGGLFSHWVDVAHWFLKLKHADSAVAYGSIDEYDDGRDTPDTITAMLQYPEKVKVTFEATLCDAREFWDVVFMGTEGRLSITRSGYTFLSKDKNAPPVTAKGAPEPPHMANFLECMRTRKDPNANVVDGHYGAMACHLVNMADRAKTKVQWKKEWDV